MDQLLKRLVVCVWLALVLIPVSATCFGFLPSGLHANAESILMTALTTFFLGGWALHAFGFFDKSE